MVVTQRDVFHESYKITVLNQFNVMGICRVGLCVTLEHLVIKSLLETLVACDRLEVLTAVRGAFTF